jgi:hypothetical protein
MGIAAHFAEQYQECRPGLNSSARSRVPVHAAMVRHNSPTLAQDFDCHRSRNTRGPVVRSLPDGKCQYARGPAQARVPAAHGGGRPSVFWWKVSGRTRPQTQGAAPGDWP